jgi:hypothetical protein
MDNCEHSITTSNIAKLHDVDTLYRCNKQEQLYTSIEVIAAGAYLYVRRVILQVFTV